MPDFGDTTVFSQSDAGNATGNMPSWNGAAAPSTIDDAGRALQGAVTREWNWRSFTLTAGGTADAKTLTYSVAPAALYNGQRFAFIANTTNTGAVTLNINTLGAKAVRKVFTGTPAALVAGDMISGMRVEVAYNQAADAFDWINQMAPLVGVLGRNFLINSEMQIDQANNGSSITISAGATGYPVDRWAVANSGGASITAGRTGLGAFGFPSCLRCTGAAGNTGVVVYQRIEAVSIADRASSAVLLSAILQANANRTVTWAARYANAVDNWSASTEFATGTISVTTSPQRFDIPITLPAQAVNGVQVSFSYGALGVGATVDITGIDLIPGSMPMAFERRPFGMELILSQRFLWKPQAGAGFSAYASAAGQGFYLLDKFPVTMRASPNATTAYGSAINLSNSSAATNPDYCEYTFTSSAAGICTTTITSARLYRAELN
jgi:hypothetical protein